MKLDSSPIDFIAILNQFVHRQSYAPLHAILLTAFNGVTEGGRQYMDLDTVR